MSVGRQGLYDLLPAVHRIRDQSEREVLQALLAVIAEQVEVLEENLEQFYDDQFIETCADWVAPYIGDLVGYRALHPVTSDIGSSRAEIANTIRYRRRKGTASMLAQLAHDVTGWDAHVVEFFQRLGWKQHMNHTRPMRGGTLNLRDYDACERVLDSNGAFDASAHTIDVRRPSAGRHNIPNIGFFFWRLKGYPVSRSDPRSVGEGRLTFNPLGIDAPVFAAAAMQELPEPFDVTRELPRRPLYDELERRRRARANREATQAVFFGDRPVFQITIDGSPVQPEEMLICNLETWRRPPESKEYRRPDGTTLQQKIRVAADPVLGRLTVPDHQPTDGVSVSYTYGFSDDMGGGPYDRTASVAQIGRIGWQRAVSKDLAPVADEIVSTVDEAIDAWNEQPPGTIGAIVVSDSHTHRVDATAERKIRIPERSRLLIAAATWPREVVPGARALKRAVGHMSADDLRPHLLGDISVIGTAAGDSDQPGTLMLNGLLIEGTVTVLAGNLGVLRIDHSTIVPEQGSLQINASAVDRARANERLSIVLDHAVSGPITCEGTIPSLKIFDSVVSNGLADDDTEPAIAAALSDLEIERSTIIGATSANLVTASNSIFTGPLVVVRRQVGCVRFCYVPRDSRAPRRHRCQPDLEIADRIARAERLRQTPLPQADRDEIRDDVFAVLVPVFTARRCGLPGFAQLRVNAPIQLRTGADDDAEMGAFHNLFQPQRESNLRIRLDEYLRVGLQAGLFFVS
jgi:hypothetical protein